MNTLYFIRHTESEANVADVLAGQMDYPLSETGLQAAATIAQAFARHAHVERILSSPLQRAVQTAEAFAVVCNLDIETDSRLLEQHIGIFSGKSYDEINGMPGYEHDRRKRWYWIPAGGGESYQMIADRVRPFLQQFEHGLSGQRILVVTHAVTLRLVRALVEDTIPEYPAEIAGNGEIWQIEFKQLGVRHSINQMMLVPSETPHRA